MQYRSRTVTGIVVVTAMAGTIVLLVLADLRRQNAKNVALAKLAEYDGTISTHYSGVREYWGAEIRLSRFGDKELRELVPFLSETSGIGYFCIAETSVTDAGCEPLSHMRHIRVLDLSGTSITSAGVERLRGMSRLVGLGLRDTRVDDSVVPVLASLHGLKRIDLENTRVSDQGVTQLLSLRQDVKVKTRRQNDLSAMRRTPTTDVPP